MFTGIIEGIGKIVGKRNTGSGIVLEFEAGFSLTEPKEGESISASGVCLTAYAIKGNRFSADVSPETLSRSKLGLLSVGEDVNLERALRLSDRLGGHIVSGHVDCLATVASRKELDRYNLFSFSLSTEQDRFIIEKGSIAIDGVSLTVNSCSSGHFSVSIIPHTLKVTTLGELKVGSKVNIEVDVIGKYVVKLLSPGMQVAAGTGSGMRDINPGFLAEHGFL
jgi:riboflavin synthase